MEFTKIRNYLFLGLLLLVTLLFLNVIKPFAYPIFWGAILAALFHPFFKRINRSLKHPNLSATITLVAVAVIIILPLLIIGILLIKEVLALYSSTSNASSQLSTALHNVTNAIKTNPYTASLNINESFWVTKFSETSKAMVNYIFTALENITQNSFNFLLLFLLMLYSLFFFVRDGEKILKKLMYLCPLGDHYEIKLYKKFTTAAGAIIKGTLILGLVQGTLGGVAFWLAGIDGAIIWGVIMALASLIPGFGCSLVWVPAGVILLIAGHVSAGIFILAVGILVISVADNLLRPILVGQNLDMPVLFILFSTLGGLMAFGFSGFMIGPIIAALFLAFWEMYEEYYHSELAHN